MPLAHLNTYPTVIFPFFFYILLNSFQINWYTFSVGGFYPGPVFPGGGVLCGGNSMLQHREKLFKEFGVITDKI